MLLPTLPQQNEMQERLLLYLFVNVGRSVGSFCIKHVAGRDRTCNYKIMTLSFYVFWKSLDLRYQLLDVGFYDGV